MIKLEVKLETGEPVKINVAAKDKEKWYKRLNQIERDQWTNRIIQAFMDILTTPDTIEDGKIVTFQNPTNTANANFQYTFSEEDKENDENFASY